MIRPFRETDCAVLIPLVQADKHMDQHEIRERLTGNTSWVYDDGTLKGCAAVTPVRETPRGKQLQLWIYTYPEERGKGIGSALWSVVSEHIAAQDVDTVGTGYRSDRGAAPEFFTKRGFAYWFSSHLMGYDGPNFPAANLEMIAYEEGLFADYVRLINEGFFDLRKTNDIHPNLPFPEGFDEDGLQSELKENRENIFFFRHHREIVGLTQLGHDYIDDLVVAQAHQRKGYGRQITQASVNKLRERGVGKAFLGVVDTNKGARALYESVGFTLVETHTFTRRKR